MERRVIRPAGSKETNLPLSQAISAGPFVFISGQIAMDPATGTFVAGDTRDQTRQVLENLQRVLTAANASMADVVRVTVFLTNIDDFGEFNEVYRTYFPTDPPTRSTVEVSRLVGTAKVEIDAIAVSR